MTISSSSGAKFEISNGLQNLFCSFHTASPIDMGTDDNERDEREVLEPAVGGEQE